MSQKHSQKSMVQALLDLITEAVASEDFETLLQMVSQKTPPEVLDTLIGLHNQNVLEKIAHLKGLAHKHVAALLTTGNSAVKITLLKSADNTLYASDVKKLAEDSCIEVRKALAASIHIDTNHNAMKKLLTDTVPSVRHAMYKNVRVQSVDSYVSKELKEKIATEITVLSMLEE